jgi:hypothetical protein
VVVESIDPFGPEPFVQFEPRRRTGERRRGESRTSPLALLAPCDDRRTLENLEVPRDRREADGLGSRQFRNGRLSDGELADDASTGGVGEGTEEQVEFVAGAFRQNI